VKTLDEELQGSRTVEIGIAEVDTWRMYVCAASFYSLYSATHKNLCLLIYGYSQARNPGQAPISPCLQIIISAN